jgi:hypothetical protein
VAQWRRDVEKNENLKDLTRPVNLSKNVDKNTAKEKKITFGNL